MYHQQFVLSPIFNDCMKVNIDGHTRPKIVPNILLRFSIQELHNSLVRDKKDGVLKEAIDAENNIIISDST